jgi:hypothetical protein
MDEITAVAILARAVETCLNEGMPANEVFAALNFLAERIPVRWPFIQFRQAFDTGEPKTLDSALAAIRLLVRVRQI